MPELTAHTRQSRQKSRYQDQRVAKSYQALRNAFLELLKLHPMEQIAISAIAHKAGVTVPVFYRQFSSKEALLADIAGKEVQRLADHVRVVIVGKDRTGELRKLCRLVGKNRDMLALLFTQGATASLRVQFTRSFNAMSLDPRAFRADLPVAVASTFIAHGVFDVLAWWLDQAREPPVSVVVQAIDTLVLEPSLCRR